MQYETSIQQGSALFSISRSVLQFAEFILINSAFKERVTRLLTGCISVRELHARDKFLQCLEYDYLISQYSTKSEERLVTE